MNAHVSSILLGVRDMERSKRFYTEGLGWEVQRDYGVSVFFEPHGGSLVGFYGRNGLAADNGVSPDSGSTVRRLAGAPSDASLQVEGWEMPGAIAGL